MPTYEVLRQNSAAKTAEILNECDSRANRTRELSILMREWKKGVLLEPITESVVSWNLGLDLCSR